MGLFKRPGGPLQGKIIQGPDGKWYNEFGEQASKDDIYSHLFWSRKQPPNLREAMMQNILSASQTGTFGVFVNPSGMTEEDKEKLSAYRVLARELGFEIGEFQFNKRSHNALATIKKM